MEQVHPGGDEATPRSIRAERLFERPLSDRAVALLFGLTASSLQIAWLAILGYEAVHVARLLL